MIDKINCKNSWKSPSGSRSITLEQIITRIKNNPKYNVHVGTDSHRNRGTNDKSHIFATVICLYEPGKGATYYYKRFVDKTIYKSLNQRMIAEATLSINTSMDLMEYINISRITVHADTNSDSRYASFPSTQIIRSWVTSLGCQFLCKPDAWASSSVADWHAK